MTDFYKLLEIDKNASSEEIRAAIKKNRRIWNNRATNPDAQIRAEAEQNVRQIAEAEKVLLDPASRTNYDMQLAAQPTHSQTKPSSANEDWQDKVIKMGDMGNFSGAYALLQSVLQEDPSNDEALFFMGLVCVDLHKTSEAIEYLNAAARMQPFNVLIFEKLGFLYDEQGESQKAYDAFQKASRIKPNEDKYKIFSAAVLRVMDRKKEAYELAKPVYENNKDDEGITELFWPILIEYAQANVSRNRASGHCVITNARQLAFMQSLKPELMEVKSSDPNITRPVAELLEAITKAEEKRIGGSSGTAVAIGIGVLIVCAIGGNAVAGLVGAAIVIGGYCLATYKPGYERNYSEASESTRKTGLQ